MRRLFDSKSVRARRILRHLVAEVPWGHNVVLLNKVKFLCKEKERVRVEYAFRDIAKPIDVATWQTKIVESLPAKLREVLPTVEELEAELGGEPKKERKRRR